MIACVHFVESYVRKSFVSDLEAEFATSLTNTVVFLISSAQQISVYALNYKGYQFMRVIRDIEMLSNSLLIAFRILIV